MAKSVDATKSIGTSTFVSALLHEDKPVLSGLNLGDSGYMLLRRINEHPGENMVPYQLVFKTKEQQYKFNHPYQCGTNYPNAAAAAGEFTHSV